MTPTLSIIVPVYNVEAYLDNCVQSILAQTYTDWELLLVDDGSRDRSGALCDQWAARDSRIRVLHQENQGQAAARNHALEVARGRYLTFVDSDDELSPDTYAPNMAYLAEHPEVELLCYPMVLDYNNAQRRKEPLREQLLCDRDSIFLAWYNHLPINKSSCSKIYRADMLRDLRYPEGHLHEDFTFHIHLIPRLSRVFISAQGEYHYYSRPSSTLHTANLQKDRDWVDAELTMVEQMAAYPQLRPELLPRYMDAARYLMNTTRPFPDADLTPQLRHLRTARPHRISLRSASKKDLFWYHIIALLGPQAFYRIYRRLLHKSNPTQQ